MSNIAKFPWSFTLEGPSKVKEVQRKAGEVEEGNAHLLRCCRRCLLQTGVTSHTRAINTWPGNLYKICAHDLTNVTQDCPADVTARDCISVIFEALCTHKHHCLGWFPLYSGSEFHQPLADLGIHAQCLLVLLFRLFCPWFVSLHGLRVLCA